MTLGSGCSVGPDFKTPPATVADHWRAGGDPRVTAQAAVDEPWWKSFHDATLDRLVELAYQQNLPLQISGLRIVEARAQLAVATGQQWPQTQALFGHRHGHRSQPKYVGLGDSASSRNFGNFQLGFDAAWELDFWGKYRRGVQAEAANMLATVADYYSALVSLTAEIARTYVSIRTFEVLIEQAEANARVQEESLNIAQSRFKNGATSELDATQAAAQLESTRSTIPQLRAGWEQARNALATLLGQPAGTVDALLGGPQADPEGARRRSGSACPRRCCGGDPTSAPRRCSRPPSAPASAWPRRSSIPASPCSAIGLRVHGLGRIPQPVLQPQPVLHGRPDGQRGRSSPTAG